MLSIVSITSPLTTVESAKASFTRVWTAFSTSVAARSLRGLKFRFRSVVKSSTSTSEAAPAWAEVFCSCWVAIACDPLLLSRIFVDRLFSHFLLQRRHELRVGQELLQRIFGRRLAVHVAEQVGELLARLQQLGGRRDLARDRRRREIVHLAELDLDRQL